MYISFQSCIALFETPCICLHGEALNAGHFCTLLSDMACSDLLQFMLPVTAVGFIQVVVNRCNLMPLVCSTELRMLGQFSFARLILYFTKSKAIPVTCCGVL
jgi:hypothetical protein